MSLVGSGLIRLVALICRCRFRPCAEHLHHGVSRWVRSGQNLLRAIGDHQDCVSLPSAPPKPGIQRSRGHGPGGGHWYGGPTPLA